MNFINQLQADNLELNQRLHATQTALNSFKRWYNQKHDAYGFEGLIMINAIKREAYPICDTVNEDVPTTNLSGITCKCEQMKAQE
jgi:hypothetical protein